MYTSKVHYALPVPVISNLWRNSISPTHSHILLTMSPYICRAYRINYQLTISTCMYQRSKLSALQHYSRARGAWIVVCKRAHNRRNATNTRRANATSFIAPGLRDNIRPRIYDCCSALTIYNVKQRFKSLCPMTSKPAGGSETASRERCWAIVMWRTTTLVPYCSCRSHNKIPNIECQLSAILAFKNVFMIPRYISLSVPSISAMISILQCAWNF